MQLLFYFFLATIAMFPTTGFATFQISQILMSGSIFDWLRSGIKKRKDANWLFDKLNELLGCSLCMSTQVAFWFFGLPYGIFLLWLFEFNVETVISMSITEWLIFTIASMFVLFATTMSTAGISFLLFKGLGYLHAKKTGHTDLEMINMFRQDESRNTSATSSSLSLNQFTNLVSLLEERCDAIFWCGVERRECRTEYIETFVRTFLVSSGHTFQEYGVNYTECIGIIMQHYFNERKGIALEYYEGEIEEDKWLASEHRSNLIETVWNSMLKDKPLVPSVQKVA